MSLAQKLMKSIPVQDAVGNVLCHDITRITIDGDKGPIFKKGHVITAEDVPTLLDVGKENIYIYETKDGILHENDAALRIAQNIVGQNITLSEPSEGRINFIATTDGLLNIDVEHLAQSNSIDEVSIATIHTLQKVNKGQKIGGTRIVPLLIEEEKIAQLESINAEPFIEVMPMRAPKVGIVTTGSEIYNGRIKDAFGPVLKKKFEEYNGTIMGQEFTSDDMCATSTAITKFIENGANLITVTGGMSVDPDDRTPLAIRQTGAEIISYGAPTFPGAMFLLAKLNNIYILGLPGCVMYYKASIFELILPRLLAGMEVTKRDIAMLGHGGFCASCPTCHYPICPFGKG